MLIRGPASRAHVIARWLSEAQHQGVALQLELSSCQVETTSSVVTTGAELSEELVRLRRTAARAAEAAEVRLLALALPPATPHEFPVTDTERYRRIGAQFGMIAHEQGICALISLISPSLLHYYSYLFSHFLSTHLSLLTLLTSSPDLHLSLNLL